MRAGGEEGMAGDNGHCCVARCAVWWWDGYGRRFHQQQNQYFVCCDFVSACRPNERRQSYAKDDRHPVRRCMRPIDYSGRDPSRSLALKQLLRVKARKVRPTSCVARREARIAVISVRLQ